MLLKDIAVHAFAHGGAASGLYFLQKDPLDASRELVLRIGLWVSMAAAICEQCRQASKGSGFPVPVPNAGAD